MSTIRHRVRRYRELILAGVFLALASWELLEMLVLEAGARPALSSTLAVHSAQVLLIFLATYAALRAWQEKSEREQILARMVEQVAFAHEDERRRIAFDLHDGLAQLIVSAKQHVDTAADSWTPAPDLARTELIRGLERLDRAVTEMRRVLMALRPPMLDALGLEGALRRLLDEAAAERGCATRLTATLGPERMPLAVETAVYRIAQEAIVNAVRHSGTPHIDVTLVVRPGALDLEVSDGGGGFVAGESRGLGLTSMRERARLLGGTLSIVSRPGAGTAVRATVPTLEVLRA
jgi:signal transduction histidine kinase